HLLRFDANNTLYAEYDESSGCANFADMREGSHKKCGNDYFLLQGDAMYLARYRLKQVVDGEVTCAALYGDRYPVLIKR
ncbi:hypothetical protein GCK32_021933, partial [Trichostrongylus colubriformis]